MKKQLEKFLFSEDIIGNKVCGNDEEIIGKIEEIVFDIEDGKICYAVLTFSYDLAKLGDDFYVMPWNVLSSHSDANTFKVNFDRDFLKSASGFRFNPDKWPDFADYNWLQSVDDFYDNFYNHSLEPYNLSIEPKSPMVKEQEDFISEGGNSQPLED